MNTIQNILEYYDELYPVSGDQKKFFEDLFSLYNKPTRLLRVNCGTGYFEHYLAKQGEDCYYDYCVWFIFYHVAYALIA